MDSFFLESGKKAAANYLFSCFSIRTYSAQTPVFHGTTV